MKKLKFSTRSIVIMIIAVMVVFGIAAAFSIRKPPPTREGYKALAGMEGPISKTDFYAILNECVTNIENHDAILAAIAPKYKKVTVEVDPKKSDLANIRNILRALKFQDQKILAIYPKYLPNKDLDGLIDGSLLRDVIQDLYNQSNIPENPLDCNPVAIQRAIDGYKKLLDKVEGSDNDANNKRMMYNGNIAQYQSRLVELAAIKGLPGNVKCVPKLLQTDAEGILDGMYVNYITKILKSQDVAITAIQDNAQNHITNFYAGYLT